MSSPLSNELFFEAHRGIGLDKDKKVKPNLGIHWSVDKSKAAEIGLKNSPLRTGNMAAVIHANIPISSAETNVEELKKLGWGFNEQDVHEWLSRDPLGEKEVMVKKGAPVTVTGKTTYTPGRMRKRTYNPPREMKA